MRASIDALSARSREELLPCNKIFEAFFKAEASRLAEAATRSGRVLGSSFPLPLPEQQRSSGWRRASVGYDGKGCEWAARRLCGCGLLRGTS